MNDLRLPSIRLIRLSALALPLVATAALAAAPPPPYRSPASDDTSDVSGCPMFPADNIWNAPVDTLPVDAMSATYVNTIGAGTKLHADFGSGLWDGGKIGIPFTTVGGDQPRVRLTFQWPGESDPGPYPIPTDAPIEGPPGKEGDRHILVVDRDRCVLYEVYHSFWQPDGSLKAGSGAMFDLRSNALRPDGWTSADAAGLPILPGLVRYDEAIDGEIAHALRFTVPQTRRAYVWPGRHFASNLMDAKYPPMGARFRLKAGVPIAGYSPEIQAILRALKRYGMILADNGSPWFVSGVPDERWNNDHVHELDKLRGSDFEAVDVASLMVHQDSGQVRGGAAAPTESPTAVATETAAPPTSTPTSTPTPTPTELSTAIATGMPTDVPLQDQLYLPFARQLVEVSVRRTAPSE